jgi:hypothetical protein
MYAVVGGGMRSNLASVEAFDELSWRPVAPMTTPRHALSVVAAGRHIYSVGGIMNGNCCAEDVEMYYAVTDTSCPCKPHLTPRKLHGLAALNDSIFAFGGAGHDESSFAEPSATTPSSLRTPGPRSPRRLRVLRRRLGRHHLRPPLGQVRLAPRPRRPHLRAPGRAAAPGLFRVRDQ